MKNKKAPLSRTPAFRLFGVTVLLLLVSSAAWAAGGKPATKLVNVADTRSLGSGPVRWMSDLYNTNLWAYGVVVVLVMAVMGLVLGLSFDRMMSGLGIKLGRIDHHE